MKKILFLCFLAISISCQVEDSADVVPANVSIAFTSCPNNLNNPSPFTSPISMFSNIDTCTDNPVNPETNNNFNTCFEIDFARQLRIEFNPNIFLPSSVEIETVFSFDSFNDTDTGAIIFSDYIPPSTNLFDFIQPNDANALYNAVACDIQSNFESLPNLPNNSYYFIIINTLNIDFALSGPTAEGTIMNLAYDIEKHSF